MQFEQFLLPSVSILPDICIQSLTDPSDISPQEAGKFWHIFHACNGILLTFVLIQHKDFSTYKK